jgi:hypothetical protein
MNWFQNQFIACDTSPLRRTPTVAACARACPIGDPQTVGVSHNSTKLIHR